MKTTAVVLILCAALCIPAILTATGDDDETYRSAYLGDFTLTEGPELDYSYIDPGFQLAGATIQVKPFVMEAPKPEDEADEDDKEDVRWEDAGKQLAAAICERTTKELHKQNITFVEGDAPYVMEGRIFEFNRGSRAARFFVGFGAGSGYLTFEFKIIDKATGKVVLAAEHRRLAPGVTTDLSDLMKEISKKDLPDFFEEIAKKGKKK